MGGDRRVSGLARLRGMVVGLLVLREGEPNVQRSDVEDDGDGDVEEAEQHHQLTGPVEKVEVDGCVCSHVGWAGWEEAAVAPGSNRLLAAALRLHFVEVHSKLWPTSDPADGGEPQKSGLTAQASCRGLCWLSCPETLLTSACARTR